MISEFIIVSMISFAELPPNKTCKLETIDKDQVVICTTPSQDKYICKDGKCLEIPLLEGTKRVSTK